MNITQRNRLVNMSARLVKLAEEIRELHTELSVVPPTKKTKVKLVSVGRGGSELEEKAKRRRWQLFSYVGGKLQSGWSGDSELRTYYIKTT